MENHFITTLFTTLFQSKSASETNRPGELATGFEIGASLKRCRLSLAVLALCWTFCFSLSPALGDDDYRPGQKVNKDYEGFAKPFLQNHCADCHEGAGHEGSLLLEDLGPVDEVNAAMWRSIWAQVTLKEMPPKDSDQPEVIQRLQFSDWVVGELTRVMRDKGGFHAILDPDKGNFVDHELLFGPLPDGIKLVPTSSPARIWRVTPQEHITRLNELINKEPSYDPAKPGLRTQGDVVPTNHGGELKLYFGTDRIIAWQGGTVAYATAVKSLPAVLSSPRHHGLENYPNFSSVNSAETTQIMNAAGDIIRYMAYGPHSIAKPFQFSDDPKAIEKIVEEVGSSDIRGLPTSLVYSTQVARPMTPIYELMKEKKVTNKRLRAAIDYLFEALTFRPPLKKESNQYLLIVKESINKLGKEDGVALGLSSIFLDRDALFRPELVEEGKPDRHGRVQLKDWELGLAVNHALRYIKPDQQLKKSITKGRMRTKADVKREVERMLADDSIRKPRVLRFFRDYFDYDLGGYICKDDKALADTGAPTKGVSHYRAMFDATASTDRLVELILQEDKNVLKQLLTTDKVVAASADNTYFGTERSGKERKQFAAANKQLKKEGGKNEPKEEQVALEKAEQELAEFQNSLEANPKPKRELKKALAAKRKAVSEAKKAVKQASQDTKRRNVNRGVAPANLNGKKIYARVSRRSFGKGTMKPDRALATALEGQRLGILTHPSWLVSHSDAMDNHAIRRGKWIQERLLGGGIPDVPITVDAMLPDEPHNTLRERMRVTSEDYCWTCHKKMDPLGLPFEMYNHAGIFRTSELDNPVDTSGEVIDSGDPELDGKVADAIELIRKLAESERAEQVFVRHAFRFWMGRNETINDAPVLQAAHRAYKDNGGSMNALIVSLLTSDAFLYRTRTPKLERTEAGLMNNSPPGGTAKARQESEETAKNAWIIDTHTHFKGAQQIAVESKTNRWNPKNTLGQVIEPKDYRAVADRNDIASTMVVEAVDQEHPQFNDWLLEHAKNSDLFCGYVARGDLNSDKFLKNYNRYRETGFLKGFRFRMDELNGYLDKPKALEHLKMLQRDAMVIDLLVEHRHTKDVIQLATKFPELKIVINHCFGARMKDGQMSDQWISAVTVCSKHENVYCKLSSILNFAGTKSFSEPAPTDLKTYQSLLQHCYDSFGEDRVIFGTNWAVCTHYGKVDDVVRIVSEFLKSKSETALRKGMRENAIRVYGIEAKHLR